MTTDLPCPDCGTEATGGKEGCVRLFEEVIGRELSQPERFQVHQMTVDAYSLQHPDPYMRSAKSAAAHITGICLAMEHRGGPAVSRTLSRWLNGALKLPRVEPPAPLQRGSLTIRHVHGAESSAEHVRRVREWAETTWKAWAIHHDQARAWVEEALDRWPRLLASASSGRLRRHPPRRDPPHGLDPVVPNRIHLVVEIHHRVAMRHDHLKRGLCSDAQFDDRGVDRGEQHSHGPNRMAFDLIVGRSFSLGVCDK